MADLSRLDSVHAAVERVAGLAPSLDVLVDNAGAIHPRHTVTPDGLEATFAPMVVGPFVMLSGLLPMLRRSERGRVIAVTSGGMYAQPLDLDDLQLDASPYGGTRAFLDARERRRLWDLVVGLTGQPDPLAEGEGLSAS